MKMILAIDPDVFVAAESDLNCKLSLIGLARNYSKIRFAVDGDEIEREYLDLLLKYVNKMQVASQEEIGEIANLLKIILSGSDEYREIVDNHRAPWLENLINEYDCTTKVEPELLGMAQNARGMGLVLLLVGNGTAYVSLRNRGLRDANIRWQFLSYMKWMDVRFTDDTDIVPAPLKDTPKAKMQDRLLELQAAFYLQGKDPYLRCIPTPPGIGGQIDVYGRKKPIRESTLEILVGECKLRKEGNEARKPIAFKEVTQTLDKMLAAARYEHRRLDGLKRTPTLKIRGALIANTSGFEGEQEDFYVCVQNYLNEHWPQSVLEFCDEVKLVLVQAILPSGWTNRADWEISRLAITETWHITGRDIDENWIWNIGVKQS